MYVNEIAVCNLLFFALNFL